MEMFAPKPRLQALIVALCAAGATLANAQQPDAAGTSAGELNLPRLPISAVSNAVPARQRVKVIGTLLMETEPGYLIIRDKTGAMRVHLNAPNASSLARGDRLEVAGLPVISERRPWLEEANARRIGTATLPAPLRVRASNALWEFYDAKLVTLRGRVVGTNAYVLRGITNEVLLTESDGIVCKMLFPPDTHAEKLFPIGTTADFSGVARLGQRIDEGQVRYLHLLLSGPDDVVLVQKAPPWSANTVRVVLLTMLSIAVLVGLWMANQWRRNRLLRASEERFRALVDNSFDVTVVLAADLAIKYLSPSAEKLFGGRNQQQALDVIHPDDRSLMAELHLTVLAEPGGTRHFASYRLVAADGTIRHAEAVGTNCLHVPGVQGVVVNIRDVTERKLAEEELRRLNLNLEQRVAERTTELQEINQRLQREVSARENAEAELRVALAAEKELNHLKSLFVSMVSHEFRTPLEVILTSSNILDRYLDRLPPEKRKTQLRAIRKSVHRMNDLIEDVLLLGKLDAGRLACNPAPIDLLAICRRAGAEIESAAGCEGIIEITAENLAEATGDETLLHHILTNLLGNALKYSSPGAAVKFTIEHCGVDAKLVITDCGCGIPDADQPRLFTQFYRGSNVGQTPGSGLGLVIVQRCVELHGGVISCHSALGVGTTFSVHLPLFDGTRIWRRRKENPAAITTNV